MRAFLLTGSPRGKRSTSHSLGAYVLEGLEDKGWEVEEGAVGEVLSTAQGIEDMIMATERADLTVLSFPTYFDSPPAPVIQAMEVLRDRRKRGGSLAALVNGGFIGSENNQASLMICRLFARDCGFDYRGGLSLGGGQLIDGRSLRDSGRMVTRTRRALDLAIDALADGRSIPPEAGAMMGRNLIPLFIFILIGNRHWKERAQENGTLAWIKDRPYQEEAR